jgi:hypothetical protein
MYRMKRRSLVLTDESARHWLRTILPPHVKRDLIPIPAEGLWRLTRADIWLSPGTEPRGVAWRLTRADICGFAGVYLAATAAILTFIL